jgi:FKBP-type peptidyl-prolyl cis-trans isomerase 2
LAALAGQTLNFEIEVMDITRLDIKHNEPFKVFFDMTIGDKDAGKIVMEVRYAPGACLLPFGRRLD